MLLAGQSNSHGWWDPVRADFAAAYRTVTLDWRGTGDSDKPDVPYSTRGFADDVIAVLDALGIERAHVYGTSMGGRVALGAPPGRSLGEAGGGAPGAGARPRAGLHLAGRSVRRGARQRRAAFPRAGHARRDPARAHRPDVHPGVDGPAPRSVRDARRPGHAGLRAAAASAGQQRPRRLGGTAVDHRPHPGGARHRRPVQPGGQRPSPRLRPGGAPIAGRIPGARVELIEGARHAYFEEFSAIASPLVRDFLGAGSS
ncbi:alpha/beta fold hydrolase [Streptomyces cheonanensis]|uniref:alpha/beta fold hydrolase n=1 Tax=Streptomyces cheonanensis TaxID=312720 RepID=UPI003D159228